MVVALTESYLVFHELKFYQWRGCGFNPPTLDVASVKLFKVVLLPLEGLPTRPIKGSRGIVKQMKNVSVV
jgi:hypothetical protein